MNLKKITAVSAIALAMGFTASGLCPSVANAAPTSSGTSGTPLPQDDGPWWWYPGGHGHGHGYGGWGHGWGGPGYYGGGISACVSAGGPWGYVSGSICI